MSEHKPDEKFSSFKPKNLTPNGVEIKAFKPRALNGEVIHDYQATKNKFGSLANTDRRLIRWVRRGCTD